MSSYCTVGSTLEVMECAKKEVERANRVFDDAKDQLQIAMDKHDLLDHALNLELSKLLSEFPHEFNAALNTVVHIQDEIKQFDVELENAIDSNVDIPDHCKSIRVITDNGVLTIIRLRLIDIFCGDFDRSVKYIRTILREAGVINVKFEKAFPEHIDEHENKVKDVIEKMIQAQDDEDYIEVSRLNYELLKLMGDIKEESKEEPEEEPKEEPEEEPKEEPEEESKEESKKKEIANVIQLIRECDDHEKYYELFKQLESLIDA